MYYCLSKDLNQIMWTKIQYKKPFITILFRPDLVLNLSTFAFFMDTFLSRWASIYIFGTFACAVFEITVSYTFITTTRRSASTFANTSFAFFSFYTCDIFARICENSSWIYVAILVSKYFEKICYNELKVCKMYLCNSHRRNKSNHYDMFLWTCHLQHLLQKPNRLSIKR